MATPTKRSLTLLTLVALAMVSGCATTEDRYWHVDGIPDGTRLIVHEPIRVSSYSGRAHVQDGAAVTPGRVNRFAAHCEIRLRGEGHDADYIEPVAFEVGGYRTRRSVVDAGDPGSVRVAVLRPGKGLFGGDRGSPSYRYATRVSLHAPEQPAVHEMICSYETASPSRHLRFDEIRATLDGVATLQRPDG